MNAIKTALLGASILIAATAAASAADVYKRDGGFKDEPSYQPAITSWAGFYAGIHAGATFGDQLELVFDDEEVDSLDVDNAFVGGIHIGYNWQKSSNLVLGVEASLGLIDDEVDGVDITDYLASIRGRLGYSFDRTLVYATGGVAFLGYSDEVANGLALDDDLAVGFVVGAGLDHKLSDKWSIGVEGLYYNFSSEIVDQLDLDRDFWTVQARLNYHFNSGYAEPLK